MKLLMLGWELPPHNSGGLGVACFQMAKALADQGADIDFVLPYKADHPDADKFMNVYLPPTYRRPLMRMATTLQWGLTLATAFGAVATATVDTPGLMAKVLSRPPISMLIGSRT